MKTEEEDSSFSLDGEFIFTKAAKEETLQRIHNIVPIETFHGKKKPFHLQEKPPPYSALKIHPKFTFHFASFATIKAHMKV